MTRARGVDVSHFVPVSDWDALYAAGYRFVSVKATEGPQFVDPRLRLHRDELRRRPFALGVFYHFARSGDPQCQAERLQDVVGQLRDNERLCLDVEVSPTPDPRDALPWIDQFYTALMSGLCSDRRPLIYTSARIWSMFGNPGWSLAGEIDLWAPRYNDAGNEPALPPPWAQAGWAFWQWSDHAHAPGVAAPCDSDYFRGDDAQLVEYARLGAGDKTPGPVADVG